MSTQLNYNIVADKSPLYTTVDQLNQSKADLQVTATNASSAPVTIKVIEIELKKVVQGVDTVQLLLPGSEGGINCPTNLTGPGGSNWSVANDDGKVTLKPTPDGTSVTFQPRDTLSLTLQNVVIREGGTGTAFVPVLEASDAGKGETQVGVGITQSTLNVQLSSDSHMVEPEGSATLTWTTTDATSGTLVLPGNSPNSISIPSASLVSGEQQVWPIGDTIYSLTCEGLGPNVTAEVSVNVDSLQMGELESSAEIVTMYHEALLLWHTNADSCTLDDGSGNPVSVPPSVPNPQYPNGYPVNPGFTPKTYTLHGTKQLQNGDFVDDQRKKDLKVFGISNNSCSATELNGAYQFDASQTITLSWETLEAVSTSLDIGGDPISIPVQNGQTQSCQLSATPDGQTLIVSTANGSNKELGRFPVPTPCPVWVPLRLCAGGQFDSCMAIWPLSLNRPQIDSFTKNIGSRSWRQGHTTEGPMLITVYWLEVSWSVSRAGSVELLTNGSSTSNAATGSWRGSETYMNPPPDTATITCTGFGGPLSQS